MERVNKFGINCRLRMVLRKKFTFNLYFFLTEYQPDSFVVAEYIRKNVPAAKFHSRRFQNVQALRSKQRTPDTLPEAIL